MKRSCNFLPLVAVLVIVTLCFQSVTIVYADNELEELLESGDKSIQFARKESGDIRIKKGVSVSGKSKSSAVINGDVIMEDKSSLKNVTINARTFGITVAKGANVTIENVSVKGASNAGIFSESGGGTLKVVNTNITGNRKGLYILPGKKIVISNNEISRNKEEGLDIRNGISGSISGNNMSDNGEGGSEIIVNGAKLIISGNKFSKNKASGLALQYYNSTASSGSIQLNTNTFTGNGNFGVTCSAPSGSKNRPGGFFSDAVHLAGNTFGLNKEGNISGVCGFVNTASEPGIVNVVEKKIVDKEVAVLSKEEQLKKEAEFALLLSSYERKYSVFQKMMTPWLAHEKQCVQTLSSAIVFNP